ncbi:MAG: substrate-binding domain-containing protein, partial [Bacilli bacterium]
SLNVSNDTRNKVVVAATKLGYKSKKIKKGIKIAIINWYNHEQEIIDPYYYYIRASAQKQCKKYGVSLKLLFSHDEITNLIDVDAIVAIGKFSKQDIHKMQLYTKNIIFVDYLPPDLEYDCVINDFKQIMQNLITMFYNDGYRNMGYIGGVEHFNTGDRISDKRYQYFIDSAKEKDVYNKDYIYQGIFTSKSGYDITKNLLSKEIQLPLVIFCANDIIAVGVHKAILESNYRIPEDIALFGFNDIEISKYLHPSLSTIHVYMDDMGKEAIEAAIQRVKNPKAIHKQIIIPTKTIIRDSYIKRKGI